jgi:hypothetical protein
MHDRIANQLNNFGMKKEQDTQTPTQSTAVSTTQTEREPAVSESSIQNAPNITNFLRLKTTIRTQKTTIENLTSMLQKSKESLDRHKLSLEKSQNIVKSLTRDIENKHEVLQAQKHNSVLELRMDIRRQEAFKLLSKLPDEFNPSTKQLIKILKNTYQDFHASDWNHYRKQGLVAYAGELPTILTKHYMPDFADDSDVIYMNSKKVPPGTPTCYS